MLFINTQNNISVSFWKFYKSVSDMVKKKNPQISSKNINFNR